MSYCRDCGKEISYKRTKNEKWMPCDYATGEPHFCQNEKSTYNKKLNQVLLTCSNCGKPYIKLQRGKKLVMLDYGTLKVHVCQKANVTRYKKYLGKKNG